MNLFKNDIIEIEITDISFEGMGVSKYENIIIFVAGVCLLEEVRVKIIKVHKSYCFAILEEIIKPSISRIIPDCNEKCGGCSYRHITYNEELLYKKRRVKNAFSKNGLITPDFEIIPSDTFHYRNKVQLPFSNDENGKIITGFYAKNSHRVIKKDQCKIQDIRFNEIITAFLEQANNQKLSVYHQENKKGFLRHIYLRSTKNEIMLCIVANGKDDRLNKIAKILFDSYEQLTSIFLNINTKSGNVILGDKFIKLNGNDCINDDLMGINFDISPASFYQVNKKQTEVLYTTGIEMLNLKNDDIAIDFYCGIGTISLCLSKYCKFVYGSEIIEAATENATENAKNNNILNVQFITGDSKDAAKQLLVQNIIPSVIVVDPPRKGCNEELINTIYEMNPEKVLYISCSPESLARDIVLFNKKGYNADKLTAVDMFPRTSHVETVCLLSKLKSDHHIEVNLNMDELDLTSAESKATYEEIKEYVLENSGFKVSSLYIGQVKEKMGIKERENYNISKKEDAKVPKCPADKEKAIIAALKHFSMID